MGGDLAARKSKAPSFIVWAVKDPDDANLIASKSSRVDEERSDFREGAGRRLVGHENPIRPARSGRSARL
jgi:hypothetical protein